MNIKFLIIVFCFISIEKASAQKAVFFPKNDSCKRVSKAQQNEYSYVVKVVNLCSNSSSIQQIDFQHDLYIRNGKYQEFYDTNYSSLRKSGSFSNGIETGIWKEYYPNRQLKYRGACEVAKLSKSLLDPNTIEFIRINSKDTFRFKLSHSIIDSLKNLSQYHYYPPYEFEGIMLPVYLSLRHGIWLFYSEKGRMIRKEYYEHGTLKQMESL
jgi:antitoxin component YwqK of YwqJK toxin-antitoxin module